jgi:hypothetical protein
VTPLQQLGKKRLRLAVEHVLGRSKSEEDGFAIAEGSRHRRHAGPSKLQAVQTEDDLRRRLKAHFRSWNDGVNASDRRGKAFAGSLDIDGATDTSDDVSAIGDIEGFYGLGALIQLIELPLSCLLVQIRRTLANDLRASRREKQLQSFDLGTSGEVLALVVHPQDAER